MAVKAGAGFVDTAQAYGSGQSERICGKLFIDLPRDQYIIQTKWYVVPENATNQFSPSKAPEKMLRQSLERMGLDYIDIYIVHGRIHASSIAKLLKVSTNASKTV